MKIRITFITMLLAVFLVFDAQSQTYTFRVLGSTGQNEVKSGNKSEPVKMGTHLNEGDVVKLSEGGYLGLQHVSGRTLEVKNPGDYSVSELAKGVSSGSSTVASRYADFVMDKMSDDGKRDRLSATGAVRRDLKTMDKEIKVYIPKNDNLNNITPDLFSDFAIVRWAPIEGVTRYEVKILSMMDEVVSVQETTDTKIALNLKDEKYAKQIGALQIRIRDVDNPKVHSGEGMDGYIIKLPKPGTVKKIEEERSKLFDQFDENSALHHYIMAGYHESNGHLIDALTSYERAIELAPGVDSFKNAYNEFLEWCGYIEVE
jgi:hypothetical protein